MAHNAFDCATPRLRISARAATGWFSTNSRRHVVAGVERATGVGLHAGAHPGRRPDSLRGLGRALGDGQRGTFGPVGAREQAGRVVISLVRPSAAGSIEGARRGAENQRRLTGSVSPERLG